MRRSRLFGATGAAGSLVLLGWTPTAAHALHGEVDAPLPFAAYIVGAAAAVAASFAFAGMADDRPAPERAPGRVRTMPRWLRLALRLLGLGAWTWIVLQTIAGGTSDAEVGSLLLWVYGWVGLALVSALLGPLWSWLDPFTTLHDIGARVGRSLGFSLPGRAPWREGVDAWPAAVLMGFFAWLELAARVGGGRELGLVLIGYTFVAVGGMAWYGRDRWRTHGEAFSVWFGLLGRLAPFGHDGPPEEGRLRRRGYGSALDTSPWSFSLLAVLAVATGSVIWDGLSQTQPYYDLVGEPGLPGDTVLLAGFLALLTVLVISVARRAGLAAMGSGLVPVAVGYLVAHYLAYLLTEGQRIAVALSDPLQQGWDLLGTARWEPRADWLSTSVVWTMQVSAVVIGHVAGAWLGHSAVRRAHAAGEPARQWPLAALMVGMTVLALWSLGQNLVFVSGEPPGAVVVGDAAP